MDERFAEYERVRAAERLCVDEYDLLVLRALALRGTVVGAAHMLYRDKETRLKFEFVSRAHARNVVRSVVERLAERARVAA